MNKKLILIFTLALFLFLNFNFTHAQSIPSCVNISNTLYCCNSAVSDNVCPEDFENATGYRVDCSVAIGAEDKDCISGPCQIKSIQTIDYCNPDNCTQGEKIGVNISYTGQCPSTAYIQVDANSTDNSCTIAWLRANIRGINVTCDGTIQNCLQNWTIPFVPIECLNKQVFSWAVGIYSSYERSTSTWVTGNDTAFPPGYGNFTFKPVCRIINASIIPYCNSEGCVNTNKTTLNITVNDATLCTAVSKIEINVSNSTYDCKIQLTNSSILKQGNNFIGNSTISIPANCEGIYVNASIAAIYSSSSIVDSKSGSFGIFKFNGTYIQDLILIPRESWRQPNTFVDYDLFGNLSNGTLVNLTFNSNTSYEADVEINRNCEHRAGDPKNRFYVKPSAQNNGLCNIYAWYLSLPNKIAIVHVTTSTTPILSEIRIAPMNAILNNIGDTETYSVRAYFSNNTNFDVSDTAKYNSSIITVANNVNSGKIFTAGRAGTTYIRTNYTHNTLTRYSELASLSVLGSVIGCYCNGNILPNTCGTYNGVEGYCSSTCTWTPCTTNEYCDENENECVVYPPVSACVSKIASSDCSDYRCFWNNTLSSGKYCEACNAPTKPSSCSSYKENYGCNADACGVGPMDISCSDSNVISCACAWSNNACYLNKTTGTGGETSCMYTTVVGECGGTACGAGQKQIIYTPSLDSPPECQTSTKCVACAQGFRPLPGFDYINIILVLGILGAIYSYSIIKNK